MKRFIKFTIISFCLLLIVGCTTGKQPYPPAPLVKFNPTLSTKTIWSRSLTYGTWGEYLRLSPAIDDERIFIFIKNNVFKYFYKRIISPMKILKTKYSWFPVNLCCYDVFNRFFKFVFPIFRADFFNFWVCQGKKVPNIRYKSVVLT